MSGNIPYIGSKISLITTSDIRYEGILYTLNREESTIAVQNVRSFGTEGRRYPEVPMSNEIYDFIIFRGKDLKDLTVLQGAPERPTNNFTAGSSDPVDGQGSSAYNQQAPQADVGFGGPSAMASVGGYGQKPGAVGGLGSSVRNGYVGATSSGSSVGAAYAAQSMLSSPYGVSGGYGAVPYQSPGASGSRPVEVKPFPGSSMTGSAGGLGMPASGLGGIGALSSGFASASADLSHRVSPPVAASAGHVGLGMGVAPPGASSLPSRQPFLSPAECSGGVSGLGDALGRVPPRGFEESNGVPLPRTPETKAPPGVRRDDYVLPPGSKEDKSGKGRGKAGGQKKPLFEVMKFHKRAEETIVKAMKSLNSSNLAPNELRSMSEMNPSVYHFYLDFVNYCCPSHTVQSDEQQWEMLCKALKKHFEKDFGSNQNQKPVQPQRPNNTLGDFITIETSKKGAKTAAKPARGGGRVGVGRGRGDKKDQMLDMGGYDEQPGSSLGSSWNCPRCTLRNENLLTECAACGTSKQQAALWDEFPPLG